DWLGNPAAHRFHAGEERRRHGAHPGRQDAELAARQRDLRRASFHRHARSSFRARPLCLRPSPVARACKRTAGRAAAPSRRFACQLCAPLLGTTVRGVNFYTPGRIGAMGSLAALLLLLQDGGAYTPPTRATVAVGETMTVTLNFSPLVMGCDNGDLV